MVELIGSGREADVYALDDRRVLRRYRRGDDAGGEAELMDHLGGLGFPVPRVFEVSGADMVMERLDGRTMTEAFGAGELGTDEGAAILAGLHHRLHELPPRFGREPGDRILHRDLHPENVMLTSRGPVVIDWHNAAEGRPGVDVCLTLIIMAQVAAEPGHPHATAAGAFLTAFIAACTVAPPGSSAAGALGDGSADARDDVFGSLGGLFGSLDEALAIRRADPALTVEDAASLAGTVVPLIRGAHRAPLGDPRFPPAR